MKPNKHVLKRNGKSASCESTEMIKEDQLPKEDASRMKRKIGKKDKSASYCCEATSTLSAEKLPPEDAY